MGIFDFLKKDTQNTLNLKGADFVPMDIVRALGFETLNVSQSEQSLINKGYGSNVIVYAIIKRIAQNIANLDKVLIDENNPDDIILEGDVFNMLANPGVSQGRVLTQYEYFESVATSLLSSGNVYQRGLLATGFGDSWQRMELLPSGRTAPVVGDSYLGGAHGFLFNDKTRDLNFTTDEIMHTKYVNPTTMGLSTLEGLSPLQAAILTLEGSTDIQKAISVITKNQGAKGLLTNESNRNGGGVNLGTTEAKAVKDQVNRAISGIDKIGSVQVTSASLKYLQMGMTAGDLKLIESGVLTDRQLCNAFGVKSNLFNDVAASTESNVKEATKSFYNDAVIPTANKLLSDINNTWLAQYSKKDNKRYKLILDTSNIEALQQDQKTEAEKDKIKMDGVNVILNMPISSGAKSSLLTSEYGYSDNDAEALVSPSGSSNPILETLKSLSPLLANKLVDGLSEEEKQNLLK
jgi:HK97 family phage portal protein